MRCFKYLLSSFLSSLSLESEVVFVDESGDPGLTPEAISKGRYFVIGFVYCRSPGLMRKKLKRLLKRLHPKKYPPHLRELKFYLPRTELFHSGYSEESLDHFEEYQPSNRMKAIRVLNETCSGVYAAVCDKTKAVEGWTSERLGNYMFAQTLVVNVMPLVNPAHSPIVIFDKGRLSASRTNEFKIYLVNKDRYFESMGIRRYSVNLGPPIDVSSLDEPGLWAADIVAGSFRHAFNAGENEYREALQASFVGNGYRGFGI
jgi:hypothetical protein